MSAVNLIAVSKYYAQQLVLNKVSLSIEQGEFVAVVGSSGCGKSTLLRLVAGLDSVSDGKILINNQCVNAIHPAKRDMAMVFQTYALYPHMTVFDNMAYGLKIRGMKPELIRKKVNKIAAMLQLSDYLLRKPQALSGGQRQRVAMGRAIVRSPAIFLFDEPLSNLDTQLRGEMRYEIKKLHKELNTTSLYVTHDQTEAMTMASKVLILNNGNVEQIGSPQMLYAKPASLFVAKFTGQYPINLLSGKIMNSQIVMPNLNIAFPLPTSKNPLPSESNVILGIRPEHIQIVDASTPGAILIKIEFIDEIGADKLIHGTTTCGREHFSVRVTADTKISDTSLSLRLIIHKANLFHQKTGIWIGGWNE